MVEKLALKKTSSSVYNINYHIVFCPKYRKQILQGDIREFVKECFETISSASDYTLIEMEIMPDHVHIFLSAKPDVSPMNIVKKLKGVSALRIFKKFPDIRKKEYWGNHFWSSSYYVGTAGVVTAEAIRKYIEANSSTI